jgi:hypothetical protein
MKIIPRFSRETIEDLIQEAAIVGGFLMLMKGLYMVYPPSMWIIGGLLLILLGFPLKGGK